jgi:hypothetical protein
VKALSVKTTATDDNYKIFVFTFHVLYAGSFKKNILNLASIIILLPNSTHRG